MNVDWFTLLLIFVFFVLPIIQQILEAKKGKPLPPMEGEEPLPEEWRQARIPGPANTPSAEAEGVATGSWSGAWGEWPGRSEPVRLEPLEVETRSLEINVRRVDEKPLEQPAWRDRAPREAPLEIAAPRAVRPVLPVPLTIRPRRPVPLDVPPGVTRSGLSGVRIPSVAGPGGRARLREAIVLNELLGLPKAARREMDPR
jgi:hypothetical protein